MIQIALRMLWHRPMRFVSTAIGMATLFFLSVAQIGLLVGCSNSR